MKTTIFLAAALAAGCTPGLEREGTSVGNPGNVTPKAALGAEVTHRSGSLSVSSLALLGCGGGTASVAVDGRVDIVAGERLEIPAGQWCGLSLETAGLWLEGTSDLSGNAYTLALDVRQIALTSPGIVVDGSGYLLELGQPGWLDSSLLGLDAGDVTVEEGHPLYTTLLAAVEGGSVLFEDDDDDGEVDDDERDNPLSDDDDDDDDDDEDDTGEEDDDEDDTGEDD